MNKVVVLVEKWGTKIKIMAEDGVDIQVFEKKDDSFTSKDKNKDIPYHYEDFSPEDLRIKKWNENFYKEIFRKKKSYEFKRKKEWDDKQKSWQKEKIRMLKKESLDLPEITEFSSVKLIRILKEEKYRKTYKYICTTSKKNKDKGCFIIITTDDFTDGCKVRLVKRNENLFLQRKEVGGKFKKTYGELLRVRTVTEEDREELLEIL